MAGETREPGSVAGPQPDDGTATPAAGGPAPAEPAPLVPGARRAEQAAAGPAPGEAAAGESAQADVAAAEAADRAELERLRTEVRELRAQAPRGGGRAAKPRHAGGRWRAPVSVVAIVLGCVLAPLSVVAVWAAGQASNTDRYVANMAPLINEPAIQSALSAKITDAVTSRLDVQAVTARAATELTRANLPQLSSLVSNFSGPITSGVDSLVGTTVSRVVASPAMAQFWVSANRTAHAGLVKVLSGQGNGTLSVVNGQVVLALGPIITQVKDQLVARGLTFASSLPAVNPTFPLFDAPNLSKAQSGYRLLLTLRWVLPVLSILLLAAGIWIARGRRHALIGAALGVAGAMLVLAAGLAIARTIYLNSVPQTTLPSDAASVLYDTLVRFIKQALRVLLLVGLVVAAGAFLTGPSTAAVRTRSAAVNGIGWVRDRGARAGVTAGPVGTWTAAHKTLLRVASVAVVALIFVFWSHPTLAVVIALVLLLLAALGVIELLGGGARAAAPKAVSPGDTAAGGPAAGR